MKGVGAAVTKSADLEKTIKKLEEEAKNSTNKLKDLEEKLKKQENLVKININKVEVKKIK